MDPTHAIPPKRIIRRRGKKKWHLVRDQAGEYYSTMCRQDLRMPEESVAYNADQINCNDCILADVREMLDRMSTSMVPSPREPAYDSEGNIL